MCPDGWTWFFMFLDRWQTLIGALLALLAGAGAVWAIWRQTRAQMRETRDRRLRLARSFRAVMPEDLKIIITYTRRSAAVQAFILRFIQAEDRGNVHGERDQKAYPELPERTLDNLRHLVENLNDTDCDYVADLIGCYQIQNSRLAQLVEDFNNPSRLERTNPTTEDWVVITIRSTVELHLLAAQMLPFARRQITSIRPPDFGTQAVHNAFIALELDQVLSPHAQNRIIRELGGDAVGEAAAGSNASGRSA